MKKQIFRRGLAILTTAAVLVSSTSAYNLLVYADQPQVGASSSAIENDGSSAVDSSVDIAVSGGKLETDFFEIEDQTVSLSGSGTQQDPYVIETLEQFLAVNSIVNNISGDYPQKFFVLDSDIDLSQLSGSSYAQNANFAYFIGCETSNANCWFNFNGQGHKIKNGTLAVSGYHTLSVFGEINASSAVTNVIFENLTLRGTSSTLNAIGVIAYKNSGTVENCTVVGCSLTDSSTNSTAAWESAKGVSGAIVQNAGIVRNVDVVDLHITTTSPNENIGALVADNVGTVTGCSVSGLVISATDANKYVGGLVGLNRSGAQVKDSSVDLPGTNDYGKNITLGNYVGGIVGKNSGTLDNTYVKGSVSTASTPSANVYNIYVTIAQAQGDDRYYGGAVGFNDSTGEVKYVTVTDLGVYAKLNSSTYSMYFGGIASRSDRQNGIHNCVAAGSFVTSTVNGSVSVYSGGIIGYADSNTAEYEAYNSAAAVNDCYALFAISNTRQKFNGAVVGYGGTDLVYRNCYWSSDISGCLSAYVGKDSDGYITEFDNVSGNLVLNTRVVADKRYDNGVISRTDLSAAWTAFSGSTAAVLGIPDENLTYRGSTDGSVLKVPYTSVVDFRSGGALPLAGATAKDRLPIAIPVNILILAADPVGDPNDPAHPLQIMDSAQAVFLYRAPYGHYKLMSDVSLSEESSNVVFTGTLDGNSHTISTIGPIFASVVGTIDYNSKITVHGGVGTDPYYTTPSELSSSVSGVIRDLTVTFIPPDDAVERETKPTETGGPTESYVIAINDAVFGSAYGAALINVALDGESYYVADVIHGRGGTLLNATYGYSYVYGCSTNVDTYFNALDATAYYANSGFIGFLGGSTVVDNCTMDFDIFGRREENYNHGGFIGKADDQDDGGYVINNTVNATTRRIDNELLQVSGFGATSIPILLGSPRGRLTFRNNFWSKDFLGIMESGGTSSLEASYAANGFFSLFKGDIVDTSSQSIQYQTVRCTVDGSTTFAITLPTRISGFSGASLSDFTVTGAQNFGVTASLSGGRLILTIDGTGVLEGSSDVVNIHHKVTGLNCFITINTTVANLQVAADGYVHISSAAELKKVSDIILENGTVDGGSRYAVDQAYKLTADIDMSAYDGSEPTKTFYPIGNIYHPFTGIFTSDVDANGDPLYTITGLKVSSKYNAHTMNGENIVVDPTVRFFSQGVGMFGVVDFTGADIEVTTGNNVSRGISNIRLVDPQVDGIDMVGALVGLAVSGHADPTVVGTGLAGLSNPANSNGAFVPSSGTQSVKITNVIIDGATVRAGVGYDSDGTVNTSSSANGKFSGVVVGAVVGSNVDINKVIVKDSTVKSYYYSATPRYYSRANLPSLTATSTMTHGFTSANVAGGMGGVIGAFSVENNQRNTAYTVNIKNTHVSGLRLTGINFSDPDEAEQHASVNAGGILGNIDKYVSTGTNATNIAKALTVNIGDPSFTASSGDLYGYDVTVDDSYVSAGGNAGGLVGSAFAHLCVNKSAVRGSDAPAAGAAQSDYATQILSDYAGDMASADMTNNGATHYLYCGVGGIAGNAGTCSENAADSNVAFNQNYYFSATGSRVEGCWIRNENDIFASTSATVSHALAGSSSVAGGIIGVGSGKAVNTASGATVNGSTQLTNDNTELSGTDSYMSDSCTVHRSHIEAVIVGGLAGICANSDALANASFMSMRFIHSTVSGCDITSSRVYGSDGSLDDESVTIPGADHLEMTGTGDSPTPQNGGLGGGVGGILGTNKQAYSSGNYSYISAGGILVDACTVDSGTRVRSAIPSVCTASGSTKKLYTAVGGVAGVISNVTGIGRYTAITNVLCSASVTADAENELVTGTGNINDTANKVRASAGGLIGAFRGLAPASGINYLHSLLKTYMHNCVFNGTVKGKSSVGGVIGQMVRAGYASGAANQTADSIGDIVMAGKIDVGNDTSPNYNGGYIVGHMTLRMNNTTVNSNNVYLGSGSGDFNYLSGTKTWLHDIYYSSLQDPDLPAYAIYMAKSAATSNAFSPLSTTYYNKQCLDRTCYDVNKKVSGTLGTTSGTNNDAVQYASLSSCDQVITYGSAPVASRGNFSVASGGNWASSNPLVLSVTGTSAQAPTLDPHKYVSTPVTVSIDYQRALTGIGANSSAFTAVLKAGFTVISTNASPLEVYTDAHGKDYCIITSPDDLLMIGWDTASGAYTSAMMAKNYAIAQDLDAGDSEFRSANPNGYKSGTTHQLPFTGSLTSLPAGSYTDHNGNPVTVSSDGPYTITGLQLGIVTDTDPTLGTVKLAGLIAVAQGAEFSNFNIEDISVVNNMADCDYIGSVAAKVYAPVGGAKAPLKAEDINVNGIDLYGANYVGGLFGGVFASTAVAPTTNAAAADNAITSSIIGCSVNGSAEDRGSISALKGAAGLLVHTSQYVMTVTDVNVSYLDISQTLATEDLTYDSGAAGLIVAYSGTMSADENDNILVSHCEITGKVASGAVVRSYSALNTYDYTSVSQIATQSNAVKNPPTKAGDSPAAYKVFSLSSIGIVDTHITGTCAVPSANRFRSFPVSAGILARADRINPYSGGSHSGYTAQHFIADCYVDSDSSVTANSVGGILGTIEGADSMTTMTSFEDGVRISGCEVSATLHATGSEPSTGEQISSTSPSTYFSNSGCGGIIGYIGKTTRIDRTVITGCSVNGVMVGEYAVGGLIGAIYTYGINSYIVDVVQDHFISDCVVASSFRKSVNSTVDSFADSPDAIGIFIGLVLGASVNSNFSVPNNILAYHKTTQTTLAASSKETFYGLYFSSAQYPYKNAMPFGSITKVNTTALGIGSGTLTEGNYSNIATQANSPDHYFTQYVYDLNTVKDYSYRPNTLGLLQQPSLASGDTYKSIYRLNNSDAASTDGKLTPSYSELLDTGVTYDVTTDISFVTPGESVNVTGTDLDFYANLGSYHTRFELVDVTVGDPAVSAVYDENSNTVTLSMSEETPVEGNISTALLLTYKNGLQLGCVLQIKIARTDMWRWYDETNSTYNYLIFNAGNLKVLSDEGTNVTGAKLIQCFDVFWSLTNEDASVRTGAETVLSAAATDTVGEYYDGVQVTLSDGTHDLLDVIGRFVHYNPDYQPGVDDNRIVSFTYTYVTSGRYPDIASVPMSELIGPIEYGDNTGEEKIACLYNEDPSAPFVGSYVSLEADSERYSADLGGTYCIYGLHLGYDNLSDDDAVCAGLFNRVGTGAVIDGANFVKPDIEIIGSKANATSAGVLAGEAVGATITNGRVSGGTLSNYHWQNASDVYAGGFVGKATGCTFTDSEVSGLTITNATLAKPRASVTAAAGGLAGSLVNSSVSGFDSDSLSIFCARSTEGYSYSLGCAGSVAGIAGSSNSPVNTISGVEVTSCTIGDCVAQITSSGSGLTASRSAQTAVNGKLLDVAGGIVGRVSDDLTITDVVFGVAGDECVVRGFDAVGGIVGDIAAVPNDITLAIGDGTDPIKVAAEVTVFGNTIEGSDISGRYYHNAAGGILGYVAACTALDIKGAEFNGTVASFSIENNRHATAGGVIGTINGTALDNICIDDAVVMGSIEGFRRTFTSDKLFFGAAGGVIGKVFSNSKKASTAKKLIKDVIVSADVLLYTTNYGTLVTESTEEDESFAPIESANGTVSDNPTLFVGKIIGSLINNAVGGDNFASTPGLNYTDYISNVVYSSYPQNIRAYGNINFYKHTTQFATDTYTDINAYTETVQVEGGNVRDTHASLQVGTSSEPVNSTSAAGGYQDDVYSDVAMIKKSNGSQERHFRLLNSEVTVGSRTIELAERDTSISGRDSRFSIVDNDGQAVSGAVVTDARYYPVTVSGQPGSYGILTVTPTQEIVATLVADYNYGLKASTTFISVDIAGSGTSSSPYLVDDVSDFIVVRYLPAAYYRQIANIDIADHYDPTDDDALFADGKGFEPIGTARMPFTGNYDGDGHIIKNLYINRPGTDDVGFFGIVNGANAVIRNLHIEIADGLEINDIGDVVNTVSGVVGRDGVGALAGSVIQAASIHNCSAARGYVIGNNKVGGLIGSANTITACTSCFTSTSVYSYNAVSASITEAEKSVGALIGQIVASGDVTVEDSFTLGYASVGNTNSYGVAGGLVGYVNANGALDISDSFIGASVSDNSLTYKGLTVGSASTSYSISADNVIVAAQRAIPDSSSTFINPILGTQNGADCTDVSYNKDLIGELRSSGLTEKTATQLSGEDIPEYYPVSVGTVTLSNSSDDSYTLGYAQLASAPISADSREDADRQKLNDDNPRIFVDTTGENNVDITTKQYLSSGYFYPLSFKTGFTTGVLSGATAAVVSGIYDKTDTVLYPELDQDLYGATGSQNKQTDLLFKDLTDSEGDPTGVTNVYRNVFSSEKAGPTLVNGVFTDYDGEVCYDRTSPYFTISESKSMSFISSGSESVTFYRKVVYPLQTRIAAGNKTIYPISTARQLNAISDARENETTAPGTKFNFFSTRVDGNLNNSYILVADVDMCGDRQGAVNFTPIESFNGTFNGKDFTVSNIKLNYVGTSAEDDIGMFRTLKAGIVENLNITVNTVTGHNNVGALVGAIVNGSSAKVLNCSVSDAANGTGVSATGTNVGGLIGAVMSMTGVTNEIKIKDCYSTVTVTGKDVVGGLIGYCAGTVSDSYATGKVYGTFTSTTQPVLVPSSGVAYRVSPAHGIGGLIGVLAGKSEYEPNGSYLSANVNGVFASGEVSVQNVAYATGVLHGVGGLIGVIQASDASLDTAFSGGNVFYCNEPDSARPSTTAGVTIGVGGLVGYSASQISGVYSGASVEAKFGNVNNNSVAVGAGGVVGVAAAGVSNAYSSRSTKGTTDTTDPVVLASANYGVGGVVGFCGNNSSFENLWYDLNFSSIGTDKPVGKSPNTATNSGSKTTAEMSKGADVEWTLENGEHAGDTNYLSGFKAFEHAYPFLPGFFENDRSLTIRLNALLSVLVIETDELDISSNDGMGISMALHLPTELNYTTPALGADDDSEGVYVFGFEAINDRSNSAEVHVDNATHTLAIQRTTDLPESIYVRVYVYTKDEQTSENGEVYADVASDIRKYDCVGQTGNEAGMNSGGTYDYPYIISTQRDLMHMGLTATESAALAGTTNERYMHWKSAVDANGDPIQDAPVYFALGGYITLDSSFDRTVDTTDNDNEYTVLHLDGKGYSIRNLDRPLFSNLNASTQTDPQTGTTTPIYSSISNMTIEGADFRDNESLVTNNAGIIEYVNVFGQASGSDTAAIAKSNSGTIKGCVNGLETQASGNNGGIAVTNSGTIELSASVGGFSNNSASVDSVGGLAAVNTGTIRQCFTYGDINLKGASNTAGFVGKNGVSGSTGTIQSCYTRCNVIVTDPVAKSSNTVGSFVGDNTYGQISDSWSSGFFSRPTTNDDTIPVFAAKAGDLSNCWYDKQMSSSGANSNTAFNYRDASRTADLVDCRYNKLPTTASVGVYPYVYNTDYDPSASARSGYLNIYYPQLAEIVNSEYDENEWADRIENNQATQAEADAAEILGRKMSLLRGYSFISSMTAMIGDDNYSDNLRIGTDYEVPVSYDATNTNIWGTVNNHIVCEPKQEGTAIYGRVVRAVSTSGNTRDVLPTNYLNFVGYNGENAGTQYNTLIRSKQMNLYFGVDGSSHPNFADGWGIQSDPFVMTNPIHVAALSYFGPNPDNYYVIEDDATLDPDYTGGIDMDDFDWEGAKIHTFAGHLDGQGLVIKDVETPVGMNSLLGNLTGTVENLGIYGITVTPDSTVSTSAGLLAATASGATVEGVYVIGDIDDSSYTGTVGGIIGTDVKPQGAQTGSTLSGVVVSGKLVSGGNVGGVVGAADGTVIENVLSTVYAKSAANPGIASCVAASGTGTIDNAICAGQAVANTVYNFAPSGFTVSDAYYDNQIASATDPDTPSDANHGKTSTELTNSGTAATLGFSSSEFTSAHVDTGNLYYPLPAAVYPSSSSALSSPFMNGLRLASARIRFMKGGSVGTPTSFTDVWASPIKPGETPRNDQITYTFASGATQCLAGGGTAHVTVSTNNLKLGEVVPAHLIYDNPVLSTTAHRYLDISVGKVLKVTYQFTGSLTNAQSSVFTLINGSTNTSVLAIGAHDTYAHRHGLATLCDAILLEGDGSGNYPIKAVTELPIGKTATVTAHVLNNDAEVTGGTLVPDNGTRDLITLTPSTLGSGDGDFDEIRFVINVSDDTKWGVHEIRNNMP